MKHGSFKTTLFFLSPVHVFMLKNPPSKSTPVLKPVWRNCSVHFYVFINEPLTKQYPLFKTTSFLKKSLVRAATGFSLQAICRDEPLTKQHPLFKTTSFLKKSLVRAATGFSLQAICRDLQCIFINIDLKIRLTHNLVWTAFAVIYFCGLCTGRSAAAAQTADCLWAEHVLQVWLQVPLQLLANHEQVSAVGATEPVCCVFRPQ